MAKIDKAKEYIGILKVYMGLLIALIISDVAGTAKLFNANIMDVTFWLGIISIIILSLIFLKLAKYTHKKINELEDI
ncbi:MAG: hypothetical protein DRG78_06420 [Epsilonproteobacteria bacterium]|nr:MAG: hypothetical protein DRG78_06420 [Campylobacterota bacterium]